MRWDLIDKFEVLKKGSHARAVKAFSGTEDFFAEHFPGKPLVPEPLLVEMIAQTGGVLFGLGLEFKKEVILVKIPMAKFLKAVAPPCLFSIEAKIDEENEDGAFVSGKVFFKKELVAQAQILLMGIEQLDPAQSKKIVFNDTFLKHYDVFEVANVSERL